MDEAAAYPLCMAAYGGHHIEVRRILGLPSGISHINQINQGFCALHLAATQGHDRVISTLLELGANPEVLSECDPTVVDNNITYGTETALCLAITSGHVKCVELLAPRTDVNRVPPSSLSQLTRMKLAMFAPNLEIPSVVSQLTAAHIAAKIGIIPVLELLKLQGADFNKETNCGTPLAL